MGEKFKLLESLFKDSQSIDLRKKYRKQRVNYIFFISIYGHIYS
jgi:hypothetical protein